jgi:hypothetical protein
MARNRFTAEDIISHVWTEKIETGNGLGIVDACRKLGITEQTHYRIGGSKSMAGCVSIRRNGCEPTADLDHCPRA